MAPACCLFFGKRGQPHFERGCCFCLFFFKSSLILFCGKLISPPTNELEKRERKHGSGTRRCWSQHHLRSRLNKIQSVEGEHQREKGRRELEGRDVPCLCGGHDARKRLGGGGKDTPQLPFLKASSRSTGALQASCPLNGNSNPDTKGKLSLSVYAVSDCVL